ncbi:MAG: hypothetical protein KC910_15580, partial [Candidatus Eremiobacteraeota bacterium]|nr:hypothetical protein [Candidatus Eremiobacteraeota bacterium]
MEPFVVDTNVLVVANGDSDGVGPACVRSCVEALQVVRRGRITLDSSGSIIREYLARLPDRSGQPGVGKEFLSHLLATQWDPRRAEQVELHPQGDSYVEFPDDPELGKFDPADRKFVAAARASSSDPTILNATDSDWWYHRQALTRYVRLGFVCPE